jgi:ribosomal protein S18 acetylase RimI-like enzyme
MTSSHEAITIRSLTPADWPAHRATRLRALADAPDAFGATLATEQQRSPESWANRLAAAAMSGNDYPLLGEAGGAPVGMLWAQRDADEPSVVNLYQMWVAPEYRGRGAATLLLRAALDWAVSKQARVVQLGVTCGDTPALRLYRRAGFEAYGTPEPLRPDSPLLSQTMRLAVHAQVQPGNHLTSEKKSPIVI